MNHRPLKLTYFELCDLHEWLDKNATSQNVYNRTYMDRYKTEFEKDTFPIATCKFPTDGSATNKTKIVLFAYLPGHEPKEEIENG